MVISYRHELIAVFSVPVRRSVRGHWQRPESGFPARAGTTAGFLATISRRRHPGGWDEGAPGRGVPAALVPETLGSRGDGGRRLGRLATRVVACSPSSVFFSLVLCHHGPSPCPLADLSLPRWALAEKRGATGHSALTSSSAGVVVSCLGVSPSTCVLEDRDGPGVSAQRALSGRAAPVCHTPRRIFLGRARSGRHPTIFGPGPTVRSDTYRRSALASRRCPGGGFPDSMGTPGPRRALLGLARAFAHEELTSLVGG